MAKAAVMDSTIETNAYQTYLDALGNDYTRRNYENHFAEFRKALKASKTCNELLEMDGRVLEDKIVLMIKAQAAAGASTSSMNMMLAAIKKFFVENRHENKINWKWLRDRVPKGNGKVKDRDYTKEELQRMWERSDIRKRAILALLMTGIRKGAISGYKEDKGKPVFIGLKVGDLTKITAWRDKESKVHQFESHIYKLTVYSGDNAEYVTFTTPEGAQAIDKYLEDRRTAGETLTASSPLIRDAYDSLNAGDPEPVTLAALDMLFTRLARSVGIRPKEKEGKRQDRHDIMLFHGIRKYVNHSYVNAEAEVIKKELLIGHNPPGLEGSYLRPTENELLREFVKVIPYLTLGKEAELQRQVEVLKVESSDSDTMRRAYLDMKEELDRIKAERQKEKEEDAEVRALLKNPKIRKLLQDES